MPKPDFIGIHPVPMAALSGFEQKQNRGARGAPFAQRPFPRFAIPAALGVGPQVKRFDQAVCGLVVVIGRVSAFHGLPPLV